LPITEDEESPLFAADEIEEALFRVVERVLERGVIISAPSSEYNGYFVTIGPDVSRADDDDDSDSASRRWRTW